MKIELTGKEASNVLEAVLAVAESDDYELQYLWTTIIDDVNYAPLLAMKGKTVKVTFEVEDNADI